MKSSTQLDSAIFQLTPTRTRCDLFIIANGKKEKLASGLLKPFLPHLKTAEDQIAKGGYSILLEPVADDDAVWFTKGTMERFVCFVSTPEILEQVYTIESEIVQTEKAIAIQGDSDTGLKTAECHQAKPVLRIEGSNSLPDHEEKATVLYTLGSQPPEADGFIVQEGNSKVQLLKVLETRKNVLRKEQGMAFARAAAAAFDMDHMMPLVSFAQCFGASRLMDACLRFMDLWKVKHESGQWLEIEVAEAVPSKSEFSIMNASEIMLSSMANKPNELRSELSSEINEKAGIDTSADTRPPMNHQVPYSQEYFPGQFPHPVFPPWPMHSPPGGLPLFQGHPMQGTPYYQNYSGNGPYHLPYYQPVEDSQLSTVQRAGQRRQSMDSRDSNTESEMWETDASRIKSQDDLEEKETSHCEPRKKAGRSGKKQSGKKQSGMVVIRNINYITSKQKNSSGSESNSDSEYDTDMDDGDLLSDAPDMRRKDRSRSSKRNVSGGKSTGEMKSYDTEEASNADGGHWQAFQNCLLRDTDKSSRAANGSMFAREKVVQMRRPQNTVGDDPLALAERDPVELQGRRLTEFHKFNGVSHFPRASNDELLTSRGECPYCNDQLVTDDMQFTDIKTKKILYMAGNDEFMIGGLENQSNLRCSSDLAVNGYEVATDNLAHMADDSTIPLRSMKLDQVGSDDRAFIDMDSELPSTHQNSENIANKIGNQVNYEPDELSLLRERRSEKRSIGYDLALDHEMHFCLEDAASKDTKTKDAVTDAKQGSTKTEDRRSKVISETLDKKKTGGPIRKGKPSKISPLDEARVRAERLRIYKAVLQKLKKEKEEAEKNRIKNLKMERQKRIAAKSSPTSAQSLLPSVATRKSLPTKLSPISHRGSKFSDSEPGSSSPLQRSKIRTALLGSTDSKKASKITKSSDDSHLTGNMLTRSVSSLSDKKKESSGVTPDSKASMAQIRRLSEPKTISSHPASSVKMRSAESVSKLKVSDGSEGEKMSAIMNLDHSTAAILPELKIKTSKGTINVNQKKLVAKKMTPKVNGGKSSVTPKSSELNTTDGRISHNNFDDNSVIEKTVVMLECQNHFIPVVQALEEKIGIRKKHDDTNHVDDKLAALPKYAAIHAPPSPIDRVDKEPTPVRSQEKPSSYEVMTNCVEKESADFSGISTCEKTYQAPFARVSSLEEPCTRNSYYGKAQASSLGSTSIENAKAHVSDFENLKLEQIPEAFEKPQVKESSKGLRRFLKLGRKNHSSIAGEQTVESVHANVNGFEQDDSATNAAASIEVYTLKNLISQDETPIAGNVLQKSLRHFSLLSHFHSKTSEKKLIT